MIGKFVLGDVHGLNTHEVNIPFVVFVVRGRGVNLGKLLSLGGIQDMCHSQFTELSDISGYGPAEGNGIM